MTAVTHNSAIELPQLLSVTVSWRSTEVLTAGLEHPHSVSSHDHYEVYIHAYGDVSMEVDGRLFLLSPGDIIILPPYALHRLTNPRRQNVRYHALYISDPNGSAYLSCLRASSEHLYLSPTIKESSRLAAHRDLFNASGEPAFPSSAKMLAALTHFISLIEDIQAADHILSPTPLSSELQSALDCIADKYMMPLSAAEIASSAGISTSLLTKLFRAEFDTTPIAYLLEYRIRKACEMLSTSLSLHDICSACGFSDYSRFIERFHRTYGITPHKLRNQL